MFLPIGDTPKPRNFVPVVTWGFIALNLIVYLLVTFPLSVQAVDPRDPALLDYLRHLGPRLPARIDLRGLSVYDLFVFEHGYKPAAPSLASLFSSMFLHGGFLHLAGNMLFLGIYGRNVEHRLGRIGYLVGYLGSGVVATLAFSLLTGPSWSPLVGASGAIAGVLGFYFVLFPRNRVKMLVVLPPFFFDVFLVPARLVLGLYILVDNLLPLMSGSQSSVAYGAHLGGFFAGLVGAMVGERLAWQWPWKDPLWRLAWARGRAVDARAAADPVVEQLPQRARPGRSPAGPRGALEPEHRAGGAARAPRVRHPRPVAARRGLLDSRDQPAAGLPRCAPGRRGPGGRLPHARLDAARAGPADGGLSAPAQRLRLRPFAGDRGARAGGPRADRHLSTASEGRPSRRPELKRQGEVPAGRREAAGSAAARRPAGADRPGVSGDRIEGRLGGCTPSIPSSRA
ncbi:MAG TPA: hypothetical protein DFS52_09055, partial [Myxococcales bacterium]|nr:hypothetical protein [Myxococcales bacterium]